jgi:hypothetical protein
VYCFQSRNVKDTSPLNANSFDFVKHFPMGNVPIGSIYQ